MQSMNVDESIGERIVKAARMAVAAHLNEAVASNELSEQIDQAGLNELVTHQS